MWFNLLLLYVFLAIILHSVVTHIIKPTTVFTKFMIVGTIVGCGLLAHCYFIWGVSLELFAAALSYAFICELYIFIFTAISTCVSVALLLQVANGTTELQQLAQHYCGATMVAKRLRRMQKIGLLQQNNNTLHLTATGAHLVKRFQALRGFFRLDDAVSVRT